MKDEVDLEKHTWIVARKSNLAMYDGHMKVEMVRSMQDRSYY